MIGSSTLGKGLVQTIIPLPDGGELFVTWSRVLAPRGWPIQALGVLPQVCTSLGQDSLSWQLAALAQGQQTMAKALEVHRAARAPLLPAQMLAIRNTCPAAEGRETDLDTARVLPIHDPASYAAALLSPTQHHGAGIRRDRAGRQALIMRLTDKAWIASSTDPEEPAMAKTNTVQIKLVSSADTGFFYVTKKNARTQTGKLELKSTIRWCASTSRSAKPRSSSAGQVLGAELCGCDLDPVATRPLGGIEREISGVEQRLGRSRFRPRQATPTLMVSRP